MNQIDVHRVRYPSCEICGARPIHRHHIKSRGAGGCDCLANLVSLCPVHHSESHTIGQARFFRKYGIADMHQHAMDHKCPQGEN